MQIFFDKEKIGNLQIYYTTKLTFLLYDNLVKTNELTSKVINS